jgi:calcineurin-like phosphoesterase family protein
MNYFISDLHLGHKNALSFDNRPFKDIDENNSAIIASWNSVVGIDDDVYILGDISWYNSTKTIEIMKSLNGRKHLIKGNHDSKLLKNRELQKEFVEITDYKELCIDKDKSIVLCHYPIPCFKNHYYGWYHFYGHVHSSFEWNMMERIKYEMKELYDKPCEMYNVGCMMPYMGYKPRTLEEIIGGNK